MQHDYEVMKHCVVSYLKAIRAKNAEIEELDARITKIESSLRPKGIDFDKVGKSSPTDETMPHGIASLIELRQRWNDVVAASKDDMSRAYDICRPEHPNRWVIWLHIVEGRSWELVGRKMGYSADHVRRLARLGYAEIYEEMPEEYRRYTIPNAVPLENVNGRILPRGRENFLP